MTDWCRGCFCSFFIEDGIIVNEKPFCGDRCFQDYEKKQIKKCIVCRKDCKKKDMVRNYYCTEKCVKDVSKLKCCCGQPVATDSVDSIEYRLCDEHAVNI